MKIIKHGTVEHLVFECDNCGCVFEALCSECSKFVGVKKEVVFSCRCPECRLPCDHNTPEPIKNSEWIPVNEKLPEDGVFVLVSVCKYGYVRMEVAARQRGRNGWYCDDDGGYYELYGVEAWMPLPKPYKKGICIEMTAE